jgi:hypothetical protein
MNKARCRICGDVIESKYTHDWVSCKGGHIFIDGGPSYQRVGTLKPGVTFDDVEYIEETESVEESSAPSGDDRKRDRR